jgi:bifunctional DNA-binding transcriptional regulator/antitoxin component of YhaV-PrlF toxin-antitoxin module
MQTTMDSFGRIVLPKKLRNGSNQEPERQIHMQEKGRKLF